MKIKYLGHASFLITTDQGTRIIFDPYESGAYGGAIGYGKIEEEADIVVTSHDHGDHNYTQDIRGAFTLINTAGTHAVKEVRLKELPTFHDTSQGKERGNNLISVLQADGLTLVHLGDLGHELDDQTLAKIGKVDVLLLPVGGFFTIDAAAAGKVMQALSPQVTIPMHYKTEKCAFPIAPVDEFLKDKKNIRVLKEVEITLTQATMPSQPEIVVLQCAL